MKRGAYILILLSVALNSCNFFYSTVEYIGKEAEPRLCVVSQFAPQDASGEPARVDVLHSEFFLRSNTQSLPVLPDATVTLQVNSLTPVTAVFMPDKDTIRSYSPTDSTLRTSTFGYYAAPLVFGGNDTIRMHVDHPQYGTVDAVQVCPMLQSAVMTVDSLSRFDELCCHVHLFAYTGAETDVLSLQVQVDDYPAYIYSTAGDFEPYDNYQTLSGYYAGQQLTLPTSSSERDLPLVIDTKVKRIPDLPVVPGNAGGSVVPPDQHQPNEPVTLHVTLRALTRTRDNYRYKISLRSAIGLTARSTPEPPSQRDTTNMDKQDLSMIEILDAVSAEFDVLGNAEGYQVYSNLTGTNSLDVQPFGCFSLVNCFEQKIEYIKH